MLWTAAARVVRIVGQSAIFIALSIGALPMVVASYVRADMLESMWARIPGRLRKTSLRSMLEVIRLQREFGFAPNKRVSEAIRTFWELDKGRFEGRKQVILANLIAKSLGVTSPILSSWSKLKSTPELSSVELIDLKAASLSALFSSGQFSDAFSLSRELTVAIDKLFFRKPGLWAENYHFSAVGHLALLHYLLIAIEVGEVPPNRITLHRCGPTGNQRYADWLHMKAIDMGVAVLATNSAHCVHEPNLELWPLAKVYGVSWHLQGLILGKLDKIKDQSQLVSAEVPEQAFDYLRSLGWDPSRPTVSFHIQDSLPRSRALRASSPGKYFQSMNRLILEGYNVVLVNRPRNKLRMPKGVILLERTAGEALVEAANLLLWQISKFFVGNLSGGTHPPGAFLTPTLWVDQHPTASFRAPGPKGMFLPKLPFFAN